MPPPCRWAPRPWPRVLRHELVARGIEAARRPQRQPRHAVAGAAGRGRDAAGPHRLRAGAAPPTCRACSTPACWTVPTTPCASGRIEEHALAGLPAAADLRPLRRHRSAVARRLPGAWRLRGPAPGAGAGAGGDRRGGGRPPACAAAAAPASRPASSGGPRPHAAGRPEIHRLQRRRGRQRHLRRPHADGGRPLHPDRGHGHRRHRRRRHQGLRLHPLRIPARLPP